MDVSPAPSPVPVLTSLSPTHAPQGQTVDVTLTGSGFVPSTTALYDGATVTTMYVSATQVVAILGNAVVATAGAHTLAASTPAPGGGTSAALAFTVDSVPMNPVPSLGSVSPTVVPAGSPDTQVTLTGSSFIAASVADANGQPLATNYVSATELQAIVPAASLAQAGTVTLTVTNPAPGGGTSAGVPLAVGGSVGGAAIVTSISPTSVLAGSMGASVFLTGSGFLPGGRVYWVTAGSSTDLGTANTSSTQVHGAIHPALLQAVGTAQVGYAQAPDGGTMSNLITIQIADPGDSGACDPVQCGSTGSNWVCRFNRCCATSGFISNCNQCCSGATWANQCTSTCGSYGTPNTGWACFCCNGSGSANCE
jgi:hypothetical protein